MSILSYHDIYKAKLAGDLVIEPYDPQCLGTNSYDVHLARTLLTYKKRIDEQLYALDCKEERETVEAVIPDEGVVLQPGKLYLASTVEYTETHKHVPFLEGKSSLGRLGLNIHITAGKGDVGFCGHWTMELSVVEPLRIYAGMPIGALIYYTISSQPTIDYAAKPNQKYAAQHTRSDNPRPVGSRMWRNFLDGRSSGRSDGRADVSDCPHVETRRGKDSPLVYGSHRTEVCKACGAFRTHGHDPGRSNLGTWQPASEYAEATAEWEA